MPYPIGGEFLPNPREGSAMDFFFEKSMQGVNATREFFRELKAAEGRDAKLALIKELQMKRAAKRAGYIGQVEVSIDLTSEPGTVQFDLEKAIADKDWIEWVLTFNEVEGIIEPNRLNGYTVTLALGNYYCNRTRATIVARTAAELLHLNIGAPIKFKGSEGEN